MVCCVWCYTWLMKEISDERVSLETTHDHQKISTNPTATRSAKIAELQMIPDPPHDPHFFRSKI